MTNTKALLVEFMLHLCNQIKVPACAVRKHDQFSGTPNALSFKTHSFVKMLCCCMILTCSTSHSYSFSFVLKNNENALSKNAAIDTAVKILDNPVLCGINAQVRLQAGIASSYQWYRNNQMLAGANQRNYTALVSGTYKVVLGDVFGNSATSRNIEITAAPKPIVDFDVNVSEQCLNGNVFIFTNKSTNPDLPLIYKWDFGDQSTSNIANPKHSYTSNASFVAKLIAYNNIACSDSVSKNIVVHPVPNPSFSVNNNQQCEAENFFQFTNNSTLSTGESNSFWQFGDGVVSNANSPGYSYRASGLFTVKLLQTSDKGCKDSISYVMKVNPSPVANFELDSYVQCFNNNVFRFINKSTISSGQMFYRWDFGDGIGQSLQTDPTYSFLRPGDYMASLRITTPQNCQAVINRILIINPSPEGKIINPATTVICDGSFVQLSASSGDFFQWHFNGTPIQGAISPNYNADTAGAYQVQFINTYGCSAFATQSVTLSKVYKPIVEFIVDKTCVGFPTQFINLTDISKTGPVDYLWNLSENITTDLPNPKVRFPSPGNYPIGLTVTPKNCKQLSAIRNAELNMQIPDVGMKYELVNAVAGRELTLNAREYKEATYEWTPSIGLSATDIFNPVFKYATPVKYFINITTDAGCEFTDTLETRMFTAQDIYVPKLFSPNNDGKNDLLYPQLVGIVNLKYFKVFNRWGKLVFQSKFPQDSWNGQYLGIDQPSGTYIWQAEGFDIDAKLLHRSGTTILIR